LRHCKKVFYSIVLFLSWQRTKPDTTKSVSKLFCTWLVFYSDTNNETTFRLQIRSNRMKQAKWDRTPTESIKCMYDTASQTDTPVCIHNDQ